MNKSTILFLAVIIAAFTRIAPGQEAEIYVDAGQPLHSLSPYLTGACLEDVNHEVYGGLYSQMIFGESFQEPPIATTDPRGPVSGMWQPMAHGTAVAGFSLDFRRPFTGVQSQRMSFISGQGDVGLQNRGLNHWGMNFIAGK